MTLGKGKIYFGSDFTALITGVTVGAAGNVLDGGIGLIGVNEGSIASTVDETGGVLAITTDTADNDNHALVAGVFSPRDGTMVVNGRWKVTSLDCAVYFGFAETMAYDTPVMPAEFATATMTYNPGGMVGFNYDVDGTTDDYRSVMGDGSAAIAGSGNGTRANADVTVDQWVEGKVEVFPDGSANCWLGSAADKNADGETNLKLVKSYTSKDGTLLTTTDKFHAVLMIENRSGNARVLEVDFFEGYGSRDWRYN